MKITKSPQTTQAQLTATYTRVSTVDQSTERQEQNIVGKLYRDKISGLTPFADRPSGKCLIEDDKHQDISFLEDELENCRNKKKLWERINWAIVIPSSLGIIGGAFYLGIFLGNNKFDREKIDLTKEVDKLKDSITAIHSNKNQHKDSIKIYQSESSYEESGSEDQRD